MMKNIILGIDTSNYTTSVAVMTEDGELLANIKRPLLVAEGERGLRQSDAVFSHIKNIPSAMVEAREYIENNRVIAVGVSERPRNQDGSYMPCFLSGVAVSEAVRIVKKYDGDDTGAFVNGILGAFVRSLAPAEEA